ncbi:hypothetical protein IOCL1545_000791100 [Leishmania shawi]|uniref:Uncharacterized protein n=1 Tax=Leishmania shawi TaxID=5680 RepID=A0ABR3DV50_9TRYP
MRIPWIAWADLRSCRAGVDLELDWQGHTSWLGDGDSDGAAEEFAADISDEAVHSLKVLLLAPSVCFPAPVLVCHAGTAADRLIASQSDTAAQLCNAGGLRSPMTDLCRSFFLNEPLSSCETWKRPPPAVYAGINVATATCSGSCLVVWTS